MSDTEGDVVGGPEAEVVEEVEEVHDGGDAGGESGAVEGGDGPFYLHLDGIQFRAGRHQVREFLHLPVDFPLDNIIMTHNHKGEAFVKVSDSAQHATCLSRNREHLESRYVVVKTSDETAFLSAASEYSAMGDGEEESAVQVDDIPHSATVSEVLGLFRGLTLASGEVVPADGELTGLVADLSKDDATKSVSDTPAFVCRKARGAPAGDAYVAFSDAETAAEALSRVSGAEMGGRTLRARVTRRGEMYARRSTTIQGATRETGTGTRPPAAALDGFVIKLKGLPFSATIEDVLAFCAEVKPIEGSVTLPLNARGRPSGEAVLSVRTPADVAAMKAKDRQYIGSRYVNVFEASAGDLTAARGVPAVRPTNAGDAAVLKLSGLPFRLRPEELLGYLAPSGARVRPDGIFLTSNADGRSSGDAFVLFESEADVARAKDLAESTPLNGRSVRARPSNMGDVYEGLQQHLGGKPPAGIRMRGVPFDATDADLSEFFRGFPVTVARMEMNPDGRPSGSGWVEFSSPNATLDALARNRCSIGPRYIDLSVQSAPGGGGRGGPPGRGGFGGGYGGGYGGPPPPRGGGGGYGGGYGGPPQGYGGGGYGGPPQGYGGPPQGYGGPPPGQGYGGPPPPGGGYGGGYGGPPQGYGGYGAAGGGGRDGPRDYDRR